MVTKAPKSAQPVELFEIDSSGDPSLKSRYQNDQNEASGRVKRVPKPLKSSEIIAQRSSTLPAIYSKAQTPKVMITNEQRNKRNNSVVDAKLKKRLRAIAHRDRQGGASLNSVQSEQDASTRHDLTAAVKDSGKFDIWDASPSSSSSFSTTTTTTQDQSTIPSSTSTSTTKTKSKSKSNTSTTNKPLALPIPDPGTSYNPLLSDHQKLLALANENAQKEEEKTEKIRSQVPSNEARKRNARDLWETVTVGAGEDDDDDDDEQTKGEGMTLTTKGKQPRRKTMKEKRKRKLNLQLEAQAKFLKKLQKNQSQSIANLPNLMSSISEQTADAQQRKAERTMLENEKAAKLGLSNKYSGPARVPMPHVDYALSEDLSEDLRTLKVEGNLWRDWERSAMRRGIIPTRRHLSAAHKSSKLHKDRRLKQVEKFAWKHFEPKEYL